MAILFYLSFLILIPLIVGLVLVMTGNGIGVYVLAIGIPGVMIVLVIVGLIMMMKGKLFNKKQSADGLNQGEGTEKEEGVAKAEEQAAIKGINSTRYFVNRYKLAEYEARNIIKGTENASKKGMAAGIIFFVLLVADFALAVVFAIKQIWAGTIVCAALFVVSIVTVLIASAVRQSKSMRADISKAEKIVDGIVKSCVMSSTVTTKAVMRNRVTAPTVRVNSVIYRVIVSADGGEYEAFSNRFYETDEKAVIAVLGKKSAKILDETEIELLSKSQFGPENASEEKDNV